MSFRIPIVIWKRRFTGIKIFTFLSKKSRSRKKLATSKFTLSSKNKKEQKQCIYKKQKFITTAVISLLFRKERSRAAKAVNDVSQNQRNNNHRRPNHRPKPPDELIAVAEKTDDKTDATNAENNVIEDNKPVNKSINDIKRVRLLTKKELFDELYEDCKDKRKREKISFIVSRMVQY